MESSSSVHSTSDAVCAICISTIINKCHSNGCRHLFCFECLKRWSNTKQSCPLCKKEFIHIYHTFNEQDIHEKYIVKYQQEPRVFFQPFIDLESIISSSSSPRRHLILELIEKLRNAQRLIRNSNSGALDPDNSFLAIPSPLPGHESRVHVYYQNIWAVPLPGSHGFYRDCSSVFYRNNPSELYNLHRFILRDIIAIRDVTRSMGHACPIHDNSYNLIMNLIMRSMSIYEIRESYMVIILRPYLMDHTSHFCHELYNYASSPYGMNGYDLKVKYGFRNTLNTPSSSTFGHQNDSRSPPGISQLIPIIPPRPNIIDNIVLDSNNERDQMTGSETDGSDDEMIPNNPIETLSSSLMDQPSTSTGIRDSLDQPNNRYNLKSQNFVLPTVNESSSIPVQVSQIAPGVGRERPIIDSSSDESTTSSQTQEPKKKKRKTNNNIKT